MSAGIPGHNIHYTFLEYRPLDDGTSRQIVELLLILGTLFLLDIVTTEIILWMGGVELNPLMAGIVANPALHLGIKAAILFLIFLVSLIAEQRVKGSGACFYCILITLYVFVFVNNAFVILLHIPR
jgi:hypothetical protein